MHGREDHLLFSFPALFFNFIDFIIGDTVQWAQGLPFPPSLFPFSPDFPYIITIVQEAHLLASLLMLTSRLSHHFVMVLSIVCAVQ